MRDLKNEVSIRWGKEFNETLQIFYDNRDEIIKREDPRFVLLISVLCWMPHDDEYGGTKHAHHIKWWNHIPLELIQEIVKKTETESN